MSATAKLLTTEQQQAIQIRKVSVALSAGAGCGKTFVLTERFLSHVSPNQQDGLDPDKLHEIVAITFTDAAAREMRSRIRNTCLARLQDAPSEEADWWLRLMRAMESARVSTIHAFCTALLRTHAVDAGLDPLFEVMDQSEADVLLSEIIDDVLREKLADKDDATIDLAATFDLARLKEMIRDVVPTIRNADIERWLVMDTDELLNIWQDRLAEEYPRLVATRIANAPQVVEIQSLLSQVEPTKESFSSAKDELLSLLPRMAKVDQEERPQELMQQIREVAGVQRICTAKDWPSKEQFDRYRDVCKALRDLIDKLPAPFDAEAARPAAELGLALLHLCKGVAREYEHHKSMRNRLDFDDQLHHAYRLLQNDSVRKELSTGLQAVLVDEFQDTDPIQVKIVEALCGEALAAGRLFFVGDYKQSIYRFRGAEPRVFRDVRSALPREGQLPLSTNFRSQGAILNFVNAQFHDAFQDEEYVPLQPQRKQVTAEPAVEFLWTPVETKRGHIDEARREEAKRIARRIKSLIASGEPIIEDTIAGKSTMRPLRLGDVAILFRALSNVRYYEEALRELGLDYYLAGGHAFYAQQEILDVLNLLRAVNSAADEIALAGLLRSPFFSLADETIFWMIESAGSLNRALASAKLPIALSDAEAGKWRFAAETLDDLRQMKDRVSIATLLNEAITRTGFAAALCAEFLGQRKLANLYKIIEQARNADQGGILSLDDFIVQLSEFTLRQPKEALAATCPDTANVIRLMTIHFAKGLEFPLVIVPDLDRKERVGGDSAVFDPELGPLVKIPDSKIATGRDLYVARESAEEAEERKRLLYVACTRAADYLILSSSLAGFDRLESDWMKHLAERFDLETGALRGQLPSGYPTPHIGVIDPASDGEWKAESQSSRPDLLKLVEEAEQLASDDLGEIPPHVGPVPLDRSAERRFSFTDLTGALIEENEEDHGDEPAIHRAEGTDPRELGRLVHALMERNGHIEDDALDAWCEELAQGEVLVDAQGAGRLAAGMIRKFRESPRAQQLAQAKKSFREIEFLLAWPPEGGASGWYFRGFIDCLYEGQAGDWRVLDYKTNNISPAQCESTAKKYELQMAVYGLAVEAALKRPPVELVLCFLRPGVEYALPWNPSVRAEAIDMVNQAIERFVSK